jgi:hypothetical protein
MSNLQLVPFTTFHGFDIGIDRYSGYFAATFEDTQLEEPTWKGLRDRIEALEKRRASEPREQQEPITMLVIHREGRYSGPPTLQKVAIAGIVAGRTNTPTLRGSTNGQKVQIKTERNGNVIVLHPDDNRLPALINLIAQEQGAREALRKTEQALADFLRTLPTIHIPGVAKKEDAIPVEATLLATLRAMKPCTENTQPEEETSNV